MRFVELLRATVLLSAAAATTLGVLTVAGASSYGDDGVVMVSASWWVAASLLGAWIGRRGQPNPAIARTLASAKAATMMPEHRPASVLVNRLWPLLVCVVVAGGLAFLVPQVTGIAAGFSMVWALSWRRQHSAVAAIEERDGVTFYVERTSPVRPVQLIRTPGFRREVPAGGTPG